MDKILEQVSIFVEDGLEIDVAQIGIQLIATLILFLVVLKFLWKPMTNLLEERRNIIENDLNEAKQANEIAHQNKLDLEQKLTDAKNEAKKIIDKSRVRGEEERNRIVTEAGQEAESRINKALENIELEYQQARESIKEEIVDVAFQVAEKIVEKEIDSSKHQEVIEDFLKEVG